MMRVMDPDGRYAPRGPGRALEHGAHRAAALHGPRRRRAGRARVPQEALPPHARRHGRRRAGRRETRRARRRGRARRGRDADRRAAAQGGPGDFNGLRRRAAHRAPNNALRVTARRLEGGARPDAALVEAVAAAKIVAVDEAIEFCHRLRQEVGPYALQAGTGFEHTEAARDAFAEPDAGVLMMKVARDRVRWFAGLEARGPSPRLGWRRRGGAALATSAARRIARARAARDVARGPCRRRGRRRTRVARPRSRAIVDRRWGAPCRKVQRHEHVAERSRLEAVSALSYGARRRAERGWTPAAPTFIRSTFESTFVGFCFCKSLFPDGLMTPRGQENSCVSFQNFLVGF